MAYRRAPPGPPSLGTMNHDALSKALFTLPPVEADLLQPGGYVVLEATPQSGKIERPYMVITSHIRNGENYPSGRGTRQKTGKLQTAPVAMQFSGA